MNSFSVCTAHNAATSKYVSLPSIHVPGADVDSHMRCRIFSTQSPRLREFVPRDSTLSAINWKRSVETRVAKLTILCANHRSCPTEGAVNNNFADLYSVSWPVFFSGTNKHPPGCMYSIEQFFLYFCVFSGKCKTQNRVILLAQITFSASLACHTTTAWSHVLYHNNIYVFL